MGTIPVRPPRVKRTTRTRLKPDTDTTIDVMRLSRVNAEKHITHPQEPPFVFGEHGLTPLAVLRERIGAAFTALRADLDAIDRALATAPAGDSGAVLAEAAGRAHAVMQREEHVGDLRTMLADLVDTGEAIVTGGKLTPNEREAARRMARESQEYTRAAARRERADAALDAVALARAQAREERDDATIDRWRLAHANALLAITDPGEPPVTLDADNGLTPIAHLRRRLRDIAQVAVRLDAALADDPIGSGDKIVGRARRLADLVREDADHGGIIRLMEDIEDAGRAIASRGRLTHAERADAEQRRRHNEVRQ